MAGVEVTAFLGAVNVVTTYFGFWVDRQDRRAAIDPRPLPEHDRVHPARGAGRGLYDRGAEDRCGHGRFFFFITSFASGVGGTGKLIQGEYFPTGVRGRAAAICASVDWLADFVIIEAFPTLNRGAGWRG